MASASPPRREHATSQAGRTCFQASIRFFMPFMRVAISCSRFGLLRSALVPLNMSFRPLQMRARLSWCQCRAEQTGTTIRRSQTESYAHVRAPAVEIGAGNLALSELLRRQSPGQETPCAERIQLRHVDAVPGDGAEVDALLRAVGPFHRKGGDRAVGEAVGRLFARGQDVGPAEPTALLLQDVLLERAVDRRGIRPRDRVEPRQEGVANRALWQAVVCG
jgi:hypothetical protein